MWKDVIINIKKKDVIIIGVKGFKNSILSFL
jgi:hypothetical protein